MRPRAHHGVAGSLTTPPALLRGGELCYICIMTDTHNNERARASAEQRAQAEVQLATAREQMLAYATEPFWEKVGHPAMDKLIADLNDAHDKLELRLRELDREIVESINDPESVEVLMPVLMLYRMSLVDTYAAMAFRAGYCRSEALRKPHDDRVMDTLASTHKMIRDWISENFDD